MPRDDRLYMTFPIDFHRHPKISRLSDKAFRAFVEMNGESRIDETDGVRDVEDADFMWTPEAMAELVNSHPTRPVVLREGDTYRLRDYAEHQFTTDDRAELSKKRSEAGKAGAAKRWQKDGNVPSLAKQEVGKPCLGTGTGTGTGTEPVSHVIETKRLSSSDEHDAGMLIPDDWRPNQQHIDKAQSLHLDVQREYTRFRSHAIQKQRRLKSWNAGFTNWLKQGAVMAQERQNTPAPARPQPMSKAAQNAANFEREFGDDTAGGIRALDA